MRLSSNLIQQLFVSFGCLINIFSAIGVIFLNKYIFINFRIQTMTLTTIQMSITSLGLCLSWRLKFFTVKSIRIAQMLPIAIVFCGFIVFSNMSLEYNTIGTYQLFKALTTPLLILISWQFYKTVYSKLVIISIIPVICGVYTHSVNDVTLNLLGTVVAVAGVISAALYQLWIGLKQEELDLSPQQLLFYQAPLSAALLTPFIIVYEKIPYYESSEEQQKVIFIVLASAFIGFILNLSTYSVIKST